MPRPHSLTPKNLPLSYECNVCHSLFELRLLGVMTVQSQFVPGSKNQFHHSILAGICQDCAASHTINSVALVTPKQSDPQDN